MLTFHMLPTWAELGVGLANHIWQSTVFMLAVAALTLLFRKNRAVVRYRLWLIASVKFLVPFSFLVGIGSFLEWHPVQQLRPIEVPVAIRQLSQPFAIPPAVASSLPAPTALPTENYPVAPFVAFVWFVGAVSVLLMWSVRWLQMVRVVRNAKPFVASVPSIQAVNRSPRVRILASPAGLEPGIFGIVRPILLLPEDISRNLEEAQLKAVIAHEMFHVRGRDNLAGAVHTIVEAAFWFHPMIWWLGNRLVDERERACDEAVLQMGCEPADYAEGILKVCKRYVLAPACVVGVSGSNLKKRIEAIMENRATPRVAMGKKLVLVLAAAGIFVGPLLCGVTGVPKPSEVPLVFVLASPVSAYETALKAAAPAIGQASASIRPQASVTPAAPGVKVPYDDVSIVSTIEEQDAVLNLSFRIAQGPGPGPAVSILPPSSQASSGQRNWADDVSIIITDQERRAFQQLKKDEEREQFIRFFWLVRDPTPGTPANEFQDGYTSRVTYANEHFTTQSGIPGSQTDRGKMYILNGPPDAIQSQPSEIVGNSIGGAIRSVPIERWHYRHLEGKGDNLVYEFVDKQGNGNYTLEYDPFRKAGIEGPGLPFNEQSKRSFRFSIGRTF